MNMREELLRLCVRCDARAASVVRHAVSQLPGLGWLLGDALLVASELVTNAVVHSKATDDDMLVVRISGNGSLRVWVLDPGASGADAAIVEGQGEFGGLGLKVVEALSSRWGTKRGPDGYAVWADLAPCG